MSIINEALKKTQKNLNKKKPPVTNAASPSAAPTIQEKQEKIVASSAPASQIETKEKKKTTWSKPVIITICLLLTTAVILFSVQMFYLIKIADKTEAPHNNQQVVQNLPMTTVTPDPQPPLKLTRRSRANTYEPAEKQTIETTRSNRISDSNYSLELSGVMTMKDGKVAIINDEVYAVGETVEGLKIINITLQSVDLSDKGKIISLKVKRKR